MDIYKLIDREALQKVDYLYWLAKVMTDELMSGHQMSLRHAWGVEFSQYKQYQAGDDVRMLDWKLLAKRDKYFIKQSEHESLVHVNFIVDSSKSMSLSNKGLSKLDFAKIMTATLGYMAYKQGDSISLNAVNDQNLNRPTTQSLDYIDFLYQLTQINADGSWPIEKSQQTFMANQGQREICVLLTDHFEQENEIWQSTLNLNSKHKHWLTAHILHPFEINADYPSDAELEDLESGERIMIGGMGVKKVMKRKFQQYLEETEKQHLLHGIGYQLVDTSQPMGEILRAFILEREAIR